ncbi:MAG TPA: methyltransferase [Bryobacteraceae bacterium]
MREFIRRVEHGTIRRVKRAFQPWRYVTYGDIRVHHKRYLDGGGSAFGQDYIPFLCDRGMPRQVRIFEWCAGPGFIGFSLLGFGLCDSLCLADINPDAVRACRRTVAENGLAERVSVYQSNNLDNVGPLERWDLVVGNPPHFDWTQTGEARFGDSGWNIHRRFFQSVGHFLKPGGVILIQENNHGSTVETFRQIIQEAGFSIVITHNCEPRVTPYTRIYYLGIMRTGETPPQWLVGP